MYEFKEENISLFVSIISNSIDYRNNIRQYFIKKIVIIITIFKEFIYIYITSIITNIITLKMQLCICTFIKQFIILLV